MGLLFLAGFLFLLNVFLFYTMECSNEYLQGRDVWGRSRLVKISDIHMQRMILASLPSYGAEGMDSLAAMIASTQEEIPEVTEAVYRAEKNPKNYEAVLELLKKRNEYSAYIQKVSDHAQSMSQTALFQAGFLRDNIAKTQKDYYGMEYSTPDPVLDYGINAYTEFHVTDILVVVLVVFAVFWMLSYRKRQADHTLADVSGVIWGTLAIVVLAAFCMYGSNWWLMTRFLGGCRLDVALQSLEAYYSCPYSMKVSGYLIVWTGLKLSGLLFLFFLMAGVCSKERRYIWIPGIPAVAFLGAEWFFRMYEGKEALWVVLREVNLFSAFYPERFFNRYMNLNLAGNAFSRLTLFGIYWSILCFVVLFGSARSMRRFTLLIREEQQRFYYEEVNRRYQETRQMWHDFHNHLLAIQALNESGDYEGANQYVREVSEQIDRNLLPVKTGVNPVDVLLFKKNQAAAQQQTPITFMVNCHLAESTIRAYDLCSILGNLLDNALEATIDVPGEKRKIGLLIKKQNEMLFISCKNTFGGERSNIGGEYQTTKKDKGQHGLGLSSVRRISKKYHGVVEAGTEDDVFVVLVLLNEIQK